MSREVCQNHKKKKFIRIPAQKETTRDNYKKKPTDSSWLRNLAEAERDKIKGVRGQQREEGQGVIDENPELQALGGGQDTSLHHSRTRSHTSLSMPNSWEHPRHPLIPHTPRKSLMSLPKDIRAYTFLFANWPPTNPWPHSPETVTTLWLWFKQARKGT